MELFYKGGNCEVKVDFACCLLRNRNDSTKVVEIILLLAKCHTKKLILNKCKFVTKMLKFSSHFVVYDDMASETCWSGETHRFPCLAQLQQIEILGRTSYAIEISNPLTGRF